MSDHNPLKPLGCKAYGSIPHLPNSRLGPGDHHIPEGQANICTVAPRRGDAIHIEEKLDGSCCAVARLPLGGIVALTRSGHLARSSKWEQHHLFADWVREREDFFRSVLDPEQWIVGEWLAQAHGTLYHITDPGQVFAPFDIFDHDRRLSTSARRDCIVEMRLTLGCTNPIWLQGPLLPSAAHQIVTTRPSLPAVGEPEGVVYRVENQAQVEFLAKWVRPDFVPGRFLPEISGQPAVWNWHPTKPTWRDNPQAPAP